MSGERTYTTNTVDFHVRVFFFLYFKQQQSVQKSLDINYRLINHHLVGKLEAARLNFYGDFLH